MPEMLPEVQISRQPDRAVILVDPQDSLNTAVLAERALEFARSQMPKVTGLMASSVSAIHGDDYFGLYFPNRTTWFQEQGTKPHTMRNLAGKTISMWVEDPSDAERRNPKTKSRLTVDGRRQWLIFRKVAAQGATRRAVRQVPGGGTRVVQVPASYPGAAGRIGRREARRPLTTTGRTPGRVATGNVGVRWRHPGITGRQFLNFGLTAAAESSGLLADALYLTDNTSFFMLVNR